MADRVFFANKAGFVLLGEKHGFGVVIIPHESWAFESSTEWETRKDLGIVGIACVLNLIAGGWKAQALGLPGL